MSTLDLCVGNESVNKFTTMTTASTHVTRLFCCQVAMAHLTGMQHSQQQQSVCGPDAHHACSQVYL